MTDHILTLNSGSSSVKFALYASAAEPCRLLHGTISGLGTSPGFRAYGASGEPLPAGDPEFDGNQALTHTEALGWLFGWLAPYSAGDRLLAAGHRVVHGGEHYSEPVRVDAGVLAQLEELVPMAPLHQRYDLDAVKALLTLRPELPQVACFDTAFHRTMPEEARNFALPRELTAAGIRRYGFHGLSYEFIAGALPEHLGADADGRVIVAHLGNGSSMCAMRSRRSIATTMGMSALDGLMMGTRSGAIDPGVLLYLMRENSMGPAELEDLLYRRSGLLGVSGIASDMRELLASKDPRAQEAVELYAYRAARELGSLAVALGGLDALVFTAGVGERAAPVRAMICERARSLGIELDASANENHGAVISSQGSGVEVCIVPTNEEVVIARHTCRVLGIGTPEQGG